MRTRKQEIARLVKLIKRAKEEIEEIEVNPHLTKQSKRVRIKTLQDEIYAHRTELIELNFTEK